MSLLDLVTGGKSSDASQKLQQALDAIRAVRTPTVDDMKFELQKMVQAGTISPTEAKTFLQQPSAFLSQNIDQTGTRAQQEAISGLLSDAQRGGLSPTEEAQMSEILNQLGTAERGANDAVVQRQAERGTLTGGETLAAQLKNNQDAAVNANLAGASTAGHAYQAMLDELTSAGQLGGSLQGQQNAQGNNVSAAVDAINRFNSAQQQGTENFNVENKNAAQAYNLENLQNVENQNVESANQHALQQSQLPQQVFQNEMQKAGAEAGIGETQANLDTQQGGQQAALIGNLIGAGGQVAAAGLAPTPQFNFSQAPVAASDGGEIHSYLDGGQVIADEPSEHAPVHGDSPENDRVPAYLSEGEIVLPRSVAQNPEPDRVMSFLNRLRKPKSPHPEDVATVFHALETMRHQPINVAAPRG